MRSFHVIVLGIALTSSGCSVFINRCGKDLHTLTTKDKVHADFGPPSATGIVDGKLYDEYRSRRHVFEPYRQTAFEMGLEMSFGLSEIMNLPIELAHLGQTILWGRNIRFIYDSNENVFNIEYNGTSYSFALLMDEQHMAAIPDTSLANQAR